MKTFNDVQVGDKIKVKENAETTNHRHYNPNWWCYVYVTAITTYSHHQALLGDYENAEGEKFGIGMFPFHMYELLEIC